MAFVEKVVAGAGWGVVARVSLFMKHYRLQSP